MINRFLGTVLIMATLLSSLYAKDSYLNIDASHFEADEKKSIMHFKGKVKMTKDKDIFLSDELIINTKASKGSANKQVPKDYKANGNVRFTIYLKDNTFKGKGDTVFYYPDQQKYIIKGNGYLEDLKEGKKLVASKIYIDEKTGHTKIDGNKNEPVKFRLKLDGDK